MEFVSNKRKRLHSSSTSNPNPNTSLLRNTNHYNTIAKHNVIFTGNTIDTTVTRNADAITGWITEILTFYMGKKVIVGLDIEWKPNRIKYMNNKAATLQLCVDTKCLIIQLKFLNYIPQSLKDFLSSTYLDATFVGVELGSDVAKLGREYGLTCRKMEDLNRWAVGLGFKRVGLKNLAMDVVGLEMRKPKYVTMSNWEVRVLSEKQVEYACIDAFVSYKIGHKLLLE